MEQDTQSLTGALPSLSLIGGFIANTKYLQEIELWHPIKDTQEHNVKYTKQYLSQTKTT
jgi:hypothetical protein